MGAAGRLYVAVKTGRPAARAPRSHPPVCVCLYSSFRGRRRISASANLFVLLLSRDVTTPSAISVHVGFLLRLPGCRLQSEEPTLVLSC